jgi:hypothetical protein
LECLLVGILGDAEAAGGEDVVRIEGAFDTLHEGEVRATRWSGGRRGAPDVDGALEFAGAPRKHGGGVVLGAESEDGSGRWGEAAEGVRVNCGGEKREVHDAGTPGEKGVGKGELPGDGAELRKKQGKAFRELGDFENGGSGGMREREGMASRMQCQSHEHSASSRRCVLAGVTASARRGSSRA